MGDDTEKRFLFFHAALLYSTQKMLVVEVFKVLVRHIGKLACHSQSHSGQRVAGVPSPHPAASKGMVLGSVSVITVICDFRRNSSEILEFSSGTLGKNSVKLDFRGRGNFCWPNLPYICLSFTNSEA